MPCGHAFGNIEKRTREIERVFLPSKYTRTHIIEKSSDKFWVINNVTKEFIFNFIGLLKDYFLKIPFKYFVLRKKRSFS